MGSGWSASRLGRFTEDERSLPPYVWIERLCDSESRSGRFGIQINLLTLPGMEPRFIGRPALCQVAIPTELSRIRCIVKWVSDIFHFNQWRSAFWSPFKSSCVVVDSQSTRNEPMPDSSASQYFLRTMHHVNSKNFMRRTKVNVTAWVFPIGY